MDLHKTGNNWVTSQYHSSTMRYVTVQEMIQMLWIIYIYMLPYTKTDPA